MAVVAVVKYKGGPDALAWKFPSEGLGTWTKLIVNESHEAILFMDGQALDVFTAGEYVLSADNIPMLNKILNLPDGVNSPLAVEIWYITKGRPLEVKWGTPAPIELPDPKYKAFIPLKALGQFSVQIDKPTTFLNNLAGAIPSFDNDSLVKQLRSLHLDMLKTNILSYIGEKDISVLETSSNLDELSEYLKEKIMPVLDELGIKMNGFRVNHIKLSEDSPVVKQINDALAKKAIAELVGSEYIQERSPEPPTLTPQPIQIEAEAEAEVIPDEFSDTPKQEQDLIVPAIRTCPVCYNDLEPGVRFCRECKYDTDPGATSPEPIKAKETEPKPEPEPEAPRFSKPKPAFETEKSVIRHCGSCGTQLRATQKFCHKCGSKS